MKYSLFLVYDYECEFRYLGATTHYKKLKEGKYKGSGLQGKMFILTENEEHKEKAKYYIKNII